MPILSKNVDQRLIETVYLIAICHETGDKWQSKTLFLSVFDLCSSSVDNVFDCHLSGVLMVFLKKNLHEKLPSMQRVKA